MSVIARKKQDSLVKVGHKSHCQLAGQPGEESGNDKMMTHNQLRKWWTTLASKLHGMMWTRHFVINRTR